MAWPASWLSDRSLNRPNGVRPTPTIAAPLTAPPRSPRRPAHRAAPLTAPPRSPRRPARVPLDEGLPPGQEVAASHRVPVQRAVQRHGRAKRQLAQPKDGLLGGGHADPARLARLPTRALE